MDDHTQSRAVLAAELVAEAIERTHQEHPAERNEVMLRKVCKGILQELLGDSGLDPIAGVLSLTFNIVEGELRAEGVMKVRGVPGHRLGAIAVGLEGDVTWKDGQIVRSDAGTS